MKLNKQALFYWMVSLFILILITAFILQLISPLFPVRQRPAYFWVGIYKAFILKEQLFIQAEIKEYQNYVEIRLPKFIMAEKINDYKNAWFNMHPLSEERYNNEK